MSLDPPPSRELNPLSRAWLKWFSSIWDMVSGKIILKTIESTGNPARGSSAPTQVYLGNTSGWKYIVGDSVYYTIIIPLDWYKNGDITYEIHWYSSNTTAARYIQWQIEWAAISMGEIITAPGHSGTIVSGDVLLPTTANVMTETIMPTIQGTNFAPDDHVVFKLSRIASTGTAPAAGDNPVMVHMEIEYQAHGIR